MTKKTQEEINYWFQDNTIKSALDLNLIEKKLHNNGLDIPNNVIIHKNGSTYEDFAHWYYDETKISKYPTTYEECCKILKINNETEMQFRNPDVERGNVYLTSTKYLINTFIRLKICRDAYWKIAGEKLGLDKPWEPDWYDQLPKYTIVVFGNNLLNHYTLAQNFILAFPTEEMRDAFLNNFKDLIESCKTLL
jgi:hypothetical protein